MGTAKLGWLAVLNDSARNCRAVRSEIAKFFISEASTSAKSGPRAMFRPALPNCPAWVIGFRRRKGVVLIHWLGVCGPRFGLPIRSGLLAK